MALPLLLPGQLSFQRCTYLIQAFVAMQGPRVLLFMMNTASVALHAISQCFSGEFHEYSLLTVIK